MCPPGLRDVAWLRLLEPSLTAVPSCCAKLSGAFGSEPQGSSAGFSIFEAVLWPRAKMLPLPLSRASGCSLSSDPSSNQGGPALSSVGSLQTGFVHPGSPYLLPLIYRMGPSEHRVGEQRFLPALTAVSECPFCLAEPRAMTDF